MREPRTISAPRSLRGELDFHLLLLNGVPLSSGGDRVRDCNFATSNSTVRVVVRRRSREFRWIAAVLVFCFTTLRLLYSRVCNRIDSLASASACRIPPFRVTDESFDD